MSHLSKPQLLDLLLASVAEAEWVGSALEKNHPFLIRASGPSGELLDFRVFIWNCTHGGGARRAVDEFRIQFTGQMPRSFTRTNTVLLGWHEGYEVFAAWDISKHENQRSNSPSAQIKEEVLRSAHSGAFATSVKQNGEVVVAFRRDLLIEYVFSSKTLHASGTAVRDLSLLDKLEDLSETEVEKVRDEERRWVISRIMRRYRASDFSRRVLAAYGHRCAVCGIQLELIEAAHINPVTEKGSTDETSNGLALCKLHHAAYDRSLISITETYDVEVSGTRCQALQSAGRHGGLGEFSRALKPVILLPADRRDYPRPENLRRGRTARKWAP